MVERLIIFRGTLAIVGAVLLGISLWIYRTRDTPALRSFALFVGTLGTLAFADALAAANITSITIVWLTTFLAIPCAFVWFIVEYYGLPHLASPGRKVAFVMPAVVALAGGSVLAVTPGVAGSMTGGGPTTPGLPSLLGFAGVAEQIGLYYAGGVMIVGIGLLFRTISKYNYLNRELAVGLSFVAFWPWLAYFMTPTIASRVSLETIIGLNAIGYTLSLAAVGFAVTRGGIFDAAPAAGTLGAETVLADLPDPVIVVDHDNRVVKFNNAATECFGLDGETDTTEAISSCIGEDLPTLRENETVELQVPNGTRHFETTVSAVSDRFGRQPGHAVIFTDVTQDRVRSQRLAVLNRVLRHNLRNGMTAIMGRAEIIASDDHKYSDSAESILSSANELMSTSETARQVERMMAFGSDTERTLNLAEVGERVISEYRTKYPDASISVDIDESLTLSVDERVLSTVLDNLVENALVHNDAPTPVVTLGARSGDGHIRISVSDNGPGIPEYERAVIESGDEDSLEHGSGLGLWAVKWGVMRLGGEVTFSDNEPQGTVVLIDLIDGGQVGSAVTTHTAEETGAWAD